jgi:hypothetical protein
MLGPMTLVAAYPASGIPILLGDFMISKGAERSRGSKKISRLRPNLAVGWSGTQLRAEAVLGSLCRELTSRPARDELEALLPQLADAGAPGLDLKLAGWIVDDEGPAAFLWDAALPCVSWGTEWFVGSGGASFEAWFRDSHVGSLHISPDEAESIDGTVEALAWLNCLDVMTKGTHPAGFGAGYEAMYWSASQTEFKYVEDVVYCVVRCCMDAHGKLHKEPRILDDKIVTYTTLPEECSLLSLTDVVSDADHEMWAMTPVGPRCSGDDVKAMLQALDDGPIRMKADHYAGLFWFLSSGPPVPPMIFAGRAARDSARIKASRGKLRLSFSSDEIETAYRLKSGAAQR